MKSHIKACQLVVLILAVSSVIGGDVVDMKPKSNHRLARGAFMDYGMILSSPVTTYLMKLARNAPDQIVKARAMHGLNSNGTVHVATTTESPLTPLLTRKILQEIKGVSYIPLVLLVSFSKDGRDANFSTFYSNNGGFIT